jgi:hypothetical protein
MTVDLPAERELSQVLQFLGASTPAFGPPGSNATFSRIGPDMALRMVSFCMGLHHRLGAGSPVFGLDPALVDDILRRFVLVQRGTVLY